MLTVKMMKKKLNNIGLATKGLHKQTVIFHMDYHTSDIITDFVMIKIQ